MLTKLIIRNFKRFDDVEVELGNPVVFIGPNNSGKTTALQALALWDIGVKRWIERRAGKPPKERPGVTINNKGDLTSIPIPYAKLLWRDLRVRSVTRSKGKQSTQNIRIEIIVEGVSQDEKWTCGLEFDYANEESFYCRPLGLHGQGRQGRMDVPPKAASMRFAFLPPMSGLTAQEVLLQPGAINVRIGEGRTAEVLRNLCYQIVQSPDGGRKRWEKLCEQIHRLFGVTLDEPKYIPERGELVMAHRGEPTYREKRGITLDLSAEGSGLRQTLLLLAYMHANPGAVLLLDEPDAHLETLRQREIYHLLTEVASEQDSQVIIATHSEVVLGEAAGRDLLVAFVGKPHRIVSGSQVQKALATIPHDHYYQAETNGWVLYLEGSTDLAILQAFADALGHGVARFLGRPFVHYVGNQPNEAEKHFYGLREAVPELRGVALFDRLDSRPANPHLPMLMWERREIENYLCYPEVLMAYAEGKQAHNLFDWQQRKQRIQIMEAIVSDRVPPVALRDRNDSWWMNTKASDEFLDKVFDEYFQKLKLPNLMQKTNYHELAKLVPENLIASEVREKLDSILKVAQEANPPVVPQ